MLWSIVVSRALAFAVSYAVATVAAVGVAGCAHPTPSGPEETLRAFADAVRGGRTDDAYRLMSADYKKSHDRDAFAHSLGPSEQRAAARLQRGKVELRADVELTDGERLALVQEPEGWRFSRDPLDFYPQRAPDEALRSFLRALERKRWEMVLRFIPLKFRNTITAETLKQRWDGAQAAELKQQIAVVRAHLDEPMEISGDEARLPVGERKQVKLLREEGAWKVETLE
ncbi:MAG: hypothetical protein JWN44_6947 [Myxococcales bacterium]|nr:hypothetical protein [Myxococcales bacterium]